MRTVLTFIILVSLAVYVSVSASPLTTTIH